MRKRPPASPRTLWPAQPPALRRLCKIRSVFGTDDYSPTGGIFFQSLQRKGRAHNAKPRTFDAAKRRGGWKTLDLVFHTKYLSV